MCHVKERESPRNNTYGLMDGLQVLSWFIFPNFLPLPWNNLTNHVFSALSRLFIIILRIKNVMRITLKIGNPNPFSSSIITYLPGFLISRINFPASSGLRLLSIINWRWQLYTTLWLISMFPNIVALHFSVGDRLKK